MSKDLRLTKVRRSSRANKKWAAEFNDGTVTHFGAPGYSDYTKHRDLDRRENYIQRHKRDLRTRNPKKPGFLSMYILWNKPSIEGSRRDFNRRLRERDWSLPY